MSSCRPTQTRRSSRTASESGPAADTATRRHGAKAIAGTPHTAASHRADSAVGSR